MSDPRLAPIDGMLDSLGADAVALVPGPNFERLLGYAFHQNERPLVLVAGRGGVCAAVVPKLEAASFDAIGLSCETVLHWRDETGFADAFAGLGRWFAARGWRRVAMEGQRMRAFEYRALQAGTPGIEMIDGQREISAIRLIKTAAEIDCLREAIRISEAALAITLDRIAPGMTETDIERSLVQSLFAEGAEGLGFSPIVAAGDNAAMPHAVARPGHVVAPGEALLFDFGASCGGLTSDITRTVFFGHVADEDAALYETVLEANRIGRETAAPGISCDALDDAVLSHLEDSDFAAFMRHKTGHGLGREVHEDPYIMRGNPTVLAPGMVFTVEPGLYRDGRVGVRIEDDVLITEGGAESLTQFPRALRVLPC